MDVLKIRQDFPILQKEINGKKIIYLDSAGMSLKPKQVIDKINEYYFDFPSCSGRSVHKLATKVSITVDDTREKIQKFINAEMPGEIIFIRNTTEGLNLIADSLIFKAGDRILTTDREHNSNLAPWLILQNKNKIKLEIVPSKPDNTFNLETFEAMMDSDVKLVSMAHTSNLDGYTIPARQIVKIAHDNNALVLLDGAQSAPHSPIDVQKLDVDFFSFSLHKMCGPTGMGVLYGKSEQLINLSPFMVGGGTVKNVNYSKYELLPPPEKFEAGLQNYAGIFGAGAAVEYLKKIGFDNIMAHELKLNQLITNKLSGQNGLQILGPKEPNLRGSIFSFNVIGMDSHNIAMILDEMENIMIRSGMQCVHSWYNKHNINGSARASVYFYNTEEDVKLFCEKIVEIIENF